ncbi:MAG: fibronectin type III domain-containing protein [Proteobacteria bacterium]|nr:fibronectin type III domain-containing protein [Pseudomonadota bacterium]
MTNAKRRCGSHRGVYLCAVAALGLALSGCGGGGGGGSAAAGSAAAGAASTAQAATSSTVVSSGSNPPTASIGAVTLNWTAPTQNTDGTPLTSLAGYNIHYGTSSGNYTQTVNVSNPGIATYVVDNLSPGTYYFSVSAVNAQGTESPLSAQVSTTVN